VPSNPPICPRQPRRTGTAARLRLRALATGAVISAALLLAACGSGSHTVQVASLSAHGNASSAGSRSLTANDGVPDPDGRPREPLNATAKQEAALYDPYFACLRAHRYVDQVSQSAKLTVAAKCQKLEPLAAWQVDPSDPQARAFIGRTVTCLEAKGYHASAVLSTNVVIQPPSWFIKYSPNRLNYVPHRPTSTEDACQQKALR
jgi:hypothetical protein